MLCWKTEAKVSLIFWIFVNIMVTEHGVCDHDFNKEINALVKRVFLLFWLTLMTPLAILQDKAGKTKIKELYKVIPSLCQVLLELVYLIFIVFYNNLQDEAVKLINVFFFSWLKLGFIKVNATSRDIRYTDFCRYRLTASEKMLFWFIYFQ